MSTSSRRRFGDAHTRTRVRTGRFDEQKEGGRHCSEVSEIWFACAADPNRGWRRTQRL